MARPQERFRDPVADFHLPIRGVPNFALTQPALRDPGPYLAHEGDYLSLYLAGQTVAAVHSAMDHRNPDRLVFSYTEIMAGFTRFCPSPRIIGMLGLGGGSLAKYARACFPESRILVAEIDPEVVAMRRAFLIPDDDDRFSVLLGDGAALVSQTDACFDVLLVDAFNEKGYPPNLATVRFYGDCHRALTGGGVLVINFSGEAWRTWFHRLNAVFRGQTVLYQCPDGDNVIVFATKGALPAWVESTRQHGAMGPVSAQPT